jgi:hypothetical protein
MTCYPTRCTIGCAFAVQYDARSRAKEIRRAPEAEVTATAAPCDQGQSPSQRRLRYVSSPAPPCASLAAAETALAGGEPPSSQCADNALLRERRIMTMTCTIPIRASCAATISNGIR